jgi:hypothetical protein
MRWWSRAKRTISLLLDPSRRQLNASKGSMRLMALFIPNAAVQMKSGSAMLPQISSKLNSSRPSAVVGMLTILKASLVGSAVMLLAGCWLSD